MSVNHIELSLEEIRHYLEGSNIIVFVFLDHTKASEFYIRTQFIQDDKKRKKRVSCRHRG